MTGKGGLLRGFPPRYDRPESVNLSRIGGTFQSRPSTLRYTQGSERARLRSGMKTLPPPLILPLQWGVGFTGLAIKLTRDIRTDWGSVPIPTRQESDSRGFLTSDKCRARSPNEIGRASCR